MNDNGPNLFHFATNELSQDAFLGWLLQWGDPAYQKANPSLHEAGKAFVQALISRQGEAPSGIDSVRAGRQWENIDVWAEVNQTHLIIIEDKVETGQHSDQLSRYRTAAEEWCRERKASLVCIYIKTRSDSSANLDRVRAEGFAVMSRRELLDFLVQHPVESDIYLDFQRYLEKLENAENGFVHKLIRDWTTDDWRGFYQALEQYRKIENWGLVNPPGGDPFWNLVLNWQYCGDIPLYMQIQQNELAFKVGDVTKQDQSLTRNHFHELLMRHRTADVPLQRPARFGKGSYMTVAFVPRTVWLGPDDSVINLPEVVERLNRMEAWLLNLIAATVVTDGVLPGSTASLQTTGGN